MYFDSLLPPSANLLFNFPLMIFNPISPLTISDGGLEWLLLDKDELENPEWQVPVLREGKSLRKTNWNRRRIGLRGARKHPS